MLKDLGGALEISANFTQELYNNWETMVTAYETGIKASKGLGFVLIYRALTNQLMYLFSPHIWEYPKQAQILFMRLRSMLHLLANPYLRLTRPIKHSHYSTNNKIISQRLNIFYNRGVNYEKITINSKDYNLDKVIDFNAICELEELGLSVPASKSPVCQLLERF